jgi:hypothetical protein
LLNGGLFTRDFLIEGIRSTAAWVALNDATVAGIRARVDALFAAFGKLKNPTEAETEKELIWPLLEALGWADMSVQQNLSTKARDDVPDALLFGHVEAKAKAAPLLPWQRFAHGLCVVEAKRWNRVLDREETRGKSEEGVPSTQMLRYLRRVDDVTKGGLRWGILTNGRQWRLYYKGALSVAEDFLEVDLGKVLGLRGCEADLLDKQPDGFADAAAWRVHVFKLFVLIFGRAAFLPDHRRETFHQLALRESKQWEARVARDLSDTVFGHVFPALGQALATTDGKAGAALHAGALAELREGALILLYRLLFVLDAEDRNLLPDESGPYADYSVTRLRSEIAEKKARGVPFSDRIKGYWSRLDGVFQAIGRGDDGLGIPAYNGGLFDPAASPVLGRVQLPDSVVADVVFRLSHIDVGDGRPPKYINYRDLSVQQLGSVYERILEHGLRVEEGRVVVAENPAARKSSGSYYTPEELVGLIIERAVGPVVSERLEAFTSKAAMLASSTRAKEARVADLLPLDPATRLLELKVCDPAMGSGHFLVSLVDWLADRVLDAMAEAAAAAGFAGYVSPLASRIEAIRARILKEAKTHRWPIAETQLDDRQIVRRMVLKRVVYGVDKNPMAVELAKVALWLHSFTVGAPLSFLDHHLRCGDSVIGAWSRPTIELLKARGALFNTGAIASVEQVARVMESIEENTDSDVAEVTASKSAFGTVEEAMGPIASFFSVLTAERLMGISDGAPKKAPPAPEKMMGKSEKQLATWHEQVRAFEAASAFGLALEGAFGDPVKIASGETQIATAELVKQLALLPAEESDPQSSLFPKISLDDRRRVLADRLVTDARARAAHHRFFHWEIGFPNVWSNLLSAEPKGGFDAVIGNPPYVRQEILGEEVKRALKADYAAFDGMADLYVYFYEQGLRLLRPGGRLSYVVTNKWLKAGYAEALRDLFATKGQVEFVADFGHAKHFFPDADVFPSVVVVRKPAPGEAAPPDTHVCVIPRDAVPEKGLSASVAAATYPLPRAHFTKESWTLEPPNVVALLDKIRRNGIPLADYAGVKPLYGIKTGLNEAFLIDTTTRDQLVKDDPGCADIIKPYLRGQDIERWWSPPSGLHMIMLKSSGDHPWPWADAPDEAEAEKRFKKAHPSLHRHMKQWETFVDADTGKTRGLRHREDQGRFWWELRPCAYYEAFDRNRLAYPDLSWSASFQTLSPGSMLSDLAFLVPSDEIALPVPLNAPITWRYLWRTVIHGKDEVLRLKTIYMEWAPVVPSIFTADIRENVTTLKWRLSEVHAMMTAIRDWLRHEFGLDKPGRALAEPHKLDADGFVTAVGAALPKTRKWSAAEIARLKQEYADTLIPARNAAADVLALERKLSDLVNAAYGLTPDEVALMWRTAPPRMPLDPAEELRRLDSRS